MKKTRALFNFLLLPLDALMVVVAFVVAYLARAKSIPFPVVYIWPFKQYLLLTLETLPIWLIAFAFAGLYRNERRAFREIGQIIVGASLGAMSLVLWVFLFRSDFFSRLVVFYIWAISIFTVGIGRAILGLIEANLHLFKIGRKRLAVIGINDPTTNHLINQIQTRPSLGYDLVGIIAEDKFGEQKKLGSANELEDIIKRYQLEEIILTDVDATNEQIFTMVRACQEAGIAFKAVPAHAQVGARTLQFDAFAGLPLIEFRGTPLDGWGAVYKRIIDFLGSIVALIITSPLMLIIAILIKIDSKGPVIYRNIRIKNGDPFVTLKFRTMQIEHCTGERYGGSRAEQYENHLIKTKNIKEGSAVYKIADDPRVTRVGKFLRRTSLDELPQFINVLLGNMSIVGPRPHQPKEVKNYTKEQRKLLLIKPGISGLAQISGRSDLTFDEEARLDIYYLENWSVWLDIFIMIQTLKVVIFGKGSY